AGERRAGRGGDVAERASSVAGRRDGEDAGGDLALDVDRLRDGYRAARAADPEERGDGSPDQARRPPVARQLDGAAADAAVTAAGDDGDGEHLDEPGSGPGVVDVAMRQQD